MLPCRPKRDRAAVHVHPAYDPGMPSEKGMISTDQPDPTLTCLQSILEEQLSLCFVLINENVPVDPAVEGAGELKDKDSFVPPVYSKPILALAKRPAARAGSHRTVETLLQVKH